MYLKGKHFLTLQDFSSEEINYLIDQAQHLKRELKNQQEHKLLPGKVLAMIFAKPSLRTRISFEVGMFQMGGTAITLKMDEINLGVRESIEDIAEVLSRYVNCVMIRTDKHKTLEHFAKNSTVPVINGLTDTFHPCQAMADVLTIREHFGTLQGLHVAYIGDGNNVATSLMLACTKLGIYFSIATPTGYEIPEHIVQQAEQNTNISHSTLKQYQNPYEAVEGADVIYTDVWTSMGQETEKETRKNIFQTYQINLPLLQAAKPQCIVMHCMPAHKGEEISIEVFDMFKNIIYQQAENRLHAQKAVLANIIP